MSDLNTSCEDLEVNRPKVKCAVIRLHTCMNRGRWRSDMMSGWSRTSGLGRRVRRREEETERELEDRKRQEEEEEESRRRTVLCFGLGIWSGDRVIDKG